MVKIGLKQGEAKRVKFTITDSTGTVVDCSSATFEFSVKEDKDDTTEIISKDNSDFDVATANVGVVYCDLSQTDTNQTPQGYTGELRVRFSSISIVKSKDITVTITQAVDIS